MKNVPSMENSDAVREYVLLRPLTRPKTSILRAVKYVILFLLSVAVLSSACYAIPFVLGAFSYFPRPIQHWMAQYPVWHKVLYALIWYLVSTLCVARKACIGLIRLYQRYASEYTRRQCVCMPTCSEYSIMCLQKYGLIKALFKIRKRLFKTCGEFGYIEDWP